MNGHYNRRTVRAGFTLIEVLLVLAILVVLGAMAVGILSGTRNRANRDAALAQVQIFDHVCPLFESHIGRMPTNLQELISPPANPIDAAKWAGPYIPQIPADPWGNEYQSQGDGVRNLRIWSTGPDGQPGTADDISNPGG